MKTNKERDMANASCKACGEIIEDGYTVCWKCGTGIGGEPPGAEFIAEGAAPATRNLDCLRCGRGMDFVRRMRFHEGSLVPGLILDVGQLLTNREHFDTYACAGCGKVEFFLAQ